MPEFPGEPDFIVSPNGEVRDVRRKRESGEFIADSEWHGPTRSTSALGSNWSGSARSQSIPGSDRHGPARSQSIPVSRVEIVSPQPKRRSGSLFSEDVKNVFGGVSFFLAVIAVAGFLGLLILSAFQWQGQQQQIASINSFLAEAENYYFQGIYENAIVSYTEAINLDPDNYQAYNGRALAYLQTGQYDQAIEDCSRSIAINPGYYLAYNNRGVAYSRKGEYPPALEDFTTAIRWYDEIYQGLSETIGGFGKAYYNRGLTYFVVDRYDLALADFDEAIRSALKNPSATYLRRMPTGPFATMMREMDQRLEEQQHVVDLPSAYCARGSVYYEMGDYEKAVADFSEAIRIRPDLAKAYYGRGTALLAAGDAQNAVADLEKVLRLNNDPDASQAAESLLSRLEIE
jgi:tetratricopeptide (TPR) repeat protein